MKDLDNKSIKELVEIYNKHAKKPVKKFADKKTALKRVKEVLPKASAAPVKEKAVPTVKKADRTVITLVAMSKDAVAPQAQGIIDCFAKVGSHMTQAELLEKMKETVETTQPLSRIYRHYREGLVEDGVLTIEEVEA